MFSEERLKVDDKTGLGMDGGCTTLLTYLMSLNSEMAKKKKVYI